MNTLKKRITLLTACCVLVLFLLLSAFVKHLMGEELLRFAGEQQRSALVLLTTQVNIALQERLDALQMMANNAKTLALDRPAAVRFFLQDRPFFASLFNGGLLLWNRQGALLSDLSTAKNDPLAWAVAPPDLAEVLATGKAAIGRLQVLAGEHKLGAFAVIVPLHNARGEVSGALGGVIRLDRSNIFSQTATHRYGKTGNFFLLDARQRLIFATSDSARVLEVLPDAGVNPWIDRFVQGFEGTARTVNPHGVEVLVSIQQIPLAHWYASVTLQPDEAFALIEAIKTPSRLMGIFFLVLVLFTLWWLLRRQFKPMTTALETLDGFVRHNQPPQALPVVRPDEIGQLVAGFNRLLIALTQQQKLLEKSKLLKQAILDSVMASIAVLDRQGTVIVHNKAWVQQVPDCAINANFLAACKKTEQTSIPGQDMSASAGIWSVLQGHLPYYHTDYACGCAPDQNWFSMSVTALRDESGEGAAVVSLQDINQRKMMEIQVRELAFYDPLTGLPNRRLAMERLSQHLAEARRVQTRLAVLFIDLDHFKPINDELGHEVGDWLLQAVTQRILGCVRQSDTAARLGGDEFLVLLPSLQTIEAALLVAEKIRSALAEEFVTDHGAVLKISSSIGVAIYPDHGHSDSDLLRIGDEAMYRAKKHSRDAVELGWAMALPAPPAAQQNRSFVRLRWKAAFNCGDPEVDQHHQHLFTLANELLSTVATRAQQPASFNAAYSRLIEDTTEHFALEEKLLLDCGCTKAAEHARLHQQLLNQAQALFIATQASEPGSVEQDKLVKFLVNQLVAEHLLKADRELFKELATTGLGLP